jgi:hypothetical protein
MQDRRDIAVGMVTAPVPREGDDRMKTLVGALAFTMIAGCGLANADDTAETVGAETASISWEGRWSASEDDMTIEYDIFVTGAEVTIAADGFQTQSRLNGRVDTTKDALEVKFNSCGSRLRNVQNDCKQHAKEEVLVTLVREGGSRVMKFKGLQPLGKAKEVVLHARPLWDGTWNAEEALRPEPNGGSAAFASYAITVAGEKVNVSVEGLQTSDKYEATAKDQGNDLVLTMAKCTEGNCGGLKKGDHIATLAREGKDTFLRFGKLTSVTEGKRQTPLDLE